MASPSRTENGVFGGWRRPFLKNPLMHTRGNQLFFSTTAGKVKEKKNLIPNSEPDTAHSLRLHLVAFIIWSRLGIISLLVWCCLSGGQHQFWSSARDLGSLGSRPAEWDNPDVKLCVRQTLLGDTSWSGCSCQGWQNRIKYPFRLICMRFTNPDVADGLYPKIRDRIDSANSLPG